MTIIAIVVAVADNRVIGSQNGLPWRIKSEMKYFKETTMGKPVIMGRKTFQSLKKALPGRKNIVITRDKNFAAEDVTVVHDLNSAILAAGMVPEICIIGGSEIYTLALPRADKIYMTEVHMKPEGDTLFPLLDHNAWIETKRERHTAQEGESADYSVTVLERIKQ